MINKNIKRIAAILIVGLFLGTAVVGIFGAINAKAWPWSFVELQDKNKKFTYKGHTVKYGYIRGRNIHIYIANVTIKNDDYSKYGDLKDRVYFSKPTHVPVPPIKTQQWTFDNHIAMIYLYVEVPDDAAQDATIIVTVKKGTAPHGSVAFTTTTIANNGIYTYSFHPGTFRTLKDITPVNKDDALYTKRTTIHYEWSESNTTFPILFQNPFYHWLGGSGDPPGYDPYGTCYAWFGYDYWDEGEWKHRDGPLQIRTPLNAKFGEVLALNVTYITTNKKTGVTTTSHKLVLIEIKETHNRVKDMRQEYGSLMTGPFWSKFYCADPIKTIEAKPGETAVYEFSVDLRGGYIKYAGTNYKEDKYELTIDKPKYFDNDEKMYISIKIPDNYCPQNDTLRVIVHGKWYSYPNQKGIERNRGTFRLLIVLHIVSKGPADVNIEKKVRSVPCGTFDDYTSVEVGDKVQFRINVTNTGYYNLSNAVIEDVFPLDAMDKLILDMENASPPPFKLGIVDIDDGTVTFLWRHVSIPVGESFTIIFNGTANQTSGLIINKARFEHLCIEKEDEANVTIGGCDEPCLEYSPESYDFGYMDECETASTTFDIWNGCSGTLEYTLSEDCGWVTLSSYTGESTGEHDTITVNINTAGLTKGTYSCDITINSNGGNGTFTVYVTIGEPHEPILAYNPSSYNFGNMQAGETASTTFEIWNQGVDTLDYNLSEDCYWLAISPTSGSSTGEHDTITINIDTTGLSEGTHSCDITINSNGGNGTFTVYVTISEDHGEKPSVEIIRPKANKLYIKDKELINFRRTFIIGPITIQANASDVDGTVEKVEFYIDDEIKHNITTTSEPYEYLWDERAFGEHIIKVKVYDNDDNTAEDEISVLIFNLGFSSIGKIR